MPNWGFWGNLGLGEGGLGGWGPRHIWLKMIPHDALIVFRDVSWGDLFFENIFCWAALRRRW